MLLQPAGRPESVPVPPVFGAPPQASSWLPHVASEPQRPAQNCVWDLLTARIGLWLESRQKEKHLKGKNDACYCLGKSSVTTNVSPGFFS